MRIILNHKKQIALMVCILLCMLMTWKTFSTTLAASDTAAATDINQKIQMISLRVIVHFMITT